MTFQVPVLGVDKQGAACVSIELDAPFDWQAGQYVRVELPGAEIMRCYSISRVEPPMRIAVKRVAGGRVSNWLNDHLKPGDTLRLTEPSGDFVLRSGSRPLVFIAGGSGITPVLSLIQQALIDGRTVQLFYASQSREDEIYSEEIDGLESQPNISIVRHYDSESGLPSKRLLQPYQSLDADFYICGPQPLLNLAEKVLEGKPRVFSERFVAQSDAHASFVPPSKWPETFSLWFAGRCRTVPYIPGKTLLECAFAAGLKPRSSCESGFCGSCMARVRQGDVSMRCMDALTSSDRTQGLALLCQSLPLDDTPLEVDADNTSFRLSQRQGYSPRKARLALAGAIALMLLGTAILRLT